MALGILIVDDDDAWRGILARALKEAGYDVLEAADGRAGIALCRTHRPGLVITDIFMPEGDGFEVLGALKGMEQPPKVLAMSGSRSGGTVDFLSATSRLGADRVLRKPFGVAELRATVRELVGEA